MQGWLSLRERLVILMVAAILPLFALSFWLALRETRSATHLTQSQLKLAAALVAANQDAAVESASQMLGAISAIPELRTGGRGKCQAYFESLLGRYPVYADIGLLDLDGQLVCHASGMLGDAAGNHSYFREAVAQRRFVMGEPIVGRSGGRSAIPFALPVVEDGRVSGVVFATLALDQAALAMARLELPPGARVMVADRQGQLLIEHPPRPSQPLPRPLRSPELVQAARATVAGAGEGRDQLGEQRVYAFVPSRPIGNEGFLAIVSIDKASVLGGTLADLRQELLVLGLTLLAGVAAAWWIGGRVIVRPAGEIVDAVQRLEGGAPDVRVRMQDGRLRGEFARIAAAFNLMAHSLQLRQQDREAELGRSRSAHAVLDLVLNSMQDALIAVNASGEFLMFNESARRLFPLHEPQVPPQQLPQLHGLYHPDGTTLYRPEELPFTRALGGEKGRNLQMLVRNALVPAGRLLQCSFQPVRGDAGIQGGLVIFTDVTALQRLQSEQALQFKQLRNTQLKLIESQRVGRIGNWEVNLLTGHTWWSDEVFKLFGVAPDSVSGTLQDLTRLLHPDDRDRHAAARQMSITQGREMNIEYRIVRPDGRLAWMHDIAESRRGGDGRPVWFGGVVQDISARKQAEADLILLRKAVARLNDIVVITKAEFSQGDAPQIVFVNQAFERVTGYSSQEAIGSTARMLQGPNTDQAVVERIRSAMAQWQPVREELVNYSRDGREFWVDMDVVPLEDEHGGFSHWIAVGRDITARKEAERSLVQSQRELQEFTRMLQRAADAAQEITSRKSLEETLQAVATQARHVIGAHQAIVCLTIDNNWEQAVSALSVSDKYGQHAHRLPIPDGTGIYAVACETGRPLRLTQQEMLAHPRWRSFGGSPDHPRIRGLLAVPLLDRNGRNIGLLLLSDKQEDDFSERDEYVALELSQLAAIAIENVRLFQQVLDFNAGLEARIAERTAALSQQEARYRALAEQAPEVVWNVDGSGAVTYLNRAWYEMVGGAPDDWLGQHWVECIHPDDVDEMQQNWRESRRALTPYSGTRRVRARDGSYHTMSYRGAPIFDDQGEVVSWVGIDTDITEFKAIERALRSSNRELEAFSYSVSHDLRAPLGAIGGFSRALSHRLEALDDERAHHFLARIQAGVSRMEQLIEDLLALAKVVRAPLRYESVDLTELARETLEGLREAHPDRKVVVTIEDGLLALGDVRLLRIAMENLLGNAWKFTSQRGDAAIDVGRLPDSKVFFVQDNGVGFDMAYVDKLFGAFQRLHTEEEFPGTGIGLATVRRIVARHQGRVWGESQLGHGASFYFVLSDLPPPSWLGTDAGKTVHAGL
jgi:PAS domain S-box-containing protein